MPYPFSDFYPALFEEDVSYAVCEIFCYRFSVLVPHITPPNVVVEAIKGVENLALPVTSLLSAWQNRIVSHKSNWRKLPNTYLMQFVCEKKV